MTVISKIINGRKVVKNKYGGNCLYITDIFDLTTEELKLFLIKKEDAPVGNLRNIYHCQSNRHLISKIARELIQLIVWNVICGKSFYFPSSNNEKIFVGVMSKGLANFKRKRNSHNKLDLFMSNFRIPEIQVYTRLNFKSQNTSVFANGIFYQEIVKRLNETGKVGGKIPERLTDILPIIYDRFPYIKRECVKLICITFLRRLKLICNYRCDLVIKDRKNVIKFFYPVSISEYDEISEQRYNFVQLKLKQDKLKYFPCQKKQLTNSMN